MQRLTLSGESRGVERQRRPEKFEGEELALPSAPPSGPSPIAVQKLVAPTPVIPAGRVPKRGRKARNSPQNPSEHPPGNWGRARSSGSSRRSGRMPRSGTDGYGG